MLSHLPVVCYFIVHQPSPSSHFRIQTSTPFDLRTTILTSCPSLPPLLCNRPPAPVLHRSHPMSVCLSVPCIARSASLTALGRSLPPGFARHRPRSLSMLSYYQDFVAQFTYSPVCLWFFLPRSHFASFHSSSFIHKLVLLSCICFSVLSVHKNAYIVVTSDVDFSDLSPGPRCSEHARALNPLPLAPVQRRLEILELHIQPFGQHHMRLRMKML